MIDFTRRTALQAVAGLPALQITDALAQEPVPNSAGSEAPKLKVPAGSCDCHHHIYDSARFPQPAEAKSPIWPNARVQEYRLLQQRLGTYRDVVVTPSAYATDNRVTLDAISQLGPNARGVAVVGADVTDAELKTLNAGGIRGIRFSLTSTTISSATMEGIEDLSGRVASLGWHTQFQTTADQVVELKDVLNRLPCALVFDHVGQVSPSGLDHPAYQIIRRLIDKGRSWVKLSVTFDNTKDGPPGFRPHAECLMFPALASLFPMRHSGSERFDVRELSAVNRAGSTRAARNIDRSGAGKQLLSYRGWVHQKKGIST